MKNTKVKDKVKYFLAVNDGSGSAWWYSVSPCFFYDPDSFLTKIIFVFKNLIGSLFIHYLPELSPVTQTEFNDLLLKNKSVTFILPVSLYEFPEIPDEDRRELF